MNDTQFKIDLNVKDAFDLLRGSNFAELIDKEFKDLGNDKQLGILIYEKYFIRVSSRVSLVVIIDNLDGYTKVKAIGSGGGRGVGSDFDWGAADSFEISVEKLFKEHLINRKNQD